MDKFRELFEVLPEDIQAVMITSDVNRRYFTGMKSSDGTILAFRDKAYLIIDFRYIEKARKTVTTAEVIEQERLFEQINSLMKKHGANRVAIESQTMTVMGLSRIREFLDLYIDIDESDQLSVAINSLRVIKSDYEIDCIKRAQRIAEKSLRDILEIIEEGMTEREIALELNHRMFINGAEDLSFETIVLSGENTSMPHGVPSDRIVRRGDFILMDFGAVFNGYHSDMTRTVCVGEPSSEMREIYDIVLESQKLALDKARSGITGEELDSIARSFIEKHGYGQFFGHSLGHGVGLEIHEFPNVSQRNKNLLPVGSVVTIEPGIYLEGKFGVRIEDFVVLDENGCENMTNFPKDLICL